MKYSIKAQLIILVYSNISYKEQLRFLCWSKDNAYPNLEYNQLKKIFQEISNAKTPIQFIDDEIVNDLEQQSVMIGELNYPPLWQQIFCPPLLIFYRGNIQLLTKKMVSVVGSRRINDYSQTMTQLLVSQLVEEKFICVSGLARGIDQVTHQSALKTKSQNSTIAIIASGLNRVYPKENWPLQEQIAKNHLLISEFPHEAPPLKHHFIMRNRLVAGISPITCVMQAAIKSGSLITAHYALQANRELFVLPGRATDLTHQGCNDLIDQGAKMIRNIEDTIKDISLIFEAHHL